MLLRHTGVYKSSFLKGVITAEQYEEITGEEYVEQEGST
jgi:hypothetical protein